MRWHGKRTTALGLIALLLLTSTVYTVAILAEEATGVFGLELAASVDTTDKSVINVTITANSFQKAINALEFKLNFEPEKVNGVVTENGSAMDGFITKSPMYTMTVSGLKTSVSCYEQICTYHGESGYYVCRFADLLDYPNAMNGTTISSALNSDGSFVVTIPFKVVGAVDSGVTFSITDVKGTTAEGLQSVRGVGDELMFTPPVVQTPSVAGNSFSLSFEDEILVNFYYTISDMSDVSEHGMLVFAEQDEIVSYDNATWVYTGRFDSSSGRNAATSEGIAAKELGDSRYYVAYAKLTDGSCVYSNQYEYSPKKYAMNMLAKTATSDAQKALCVAMLNYGAEAQKYFGYNVESLMNASLTDQQKALVTAYEESLFVGAVAADSSKTGDFAATATGFSRKSASVSFDGAFAINYYFTPDLAAAGDMVLYFWNPLDYANADVLKADNASGSVAMVAGDDGVYWAQVDGIAAKNLDETYYVAAVYTDDAGNRCCSGVVPYSLSKYCMNNAKDGKVMKDLAAATAMYGYYAKQFFSA